MNLSINQMFISMNVTRYLIFKNALKKKEFFTVIWFHGGGWINWRKKEIPKYLQEKGLRL